MTKGTAVRLIDDACFNVGGTGTSLFSDTPEMLTDVMKVLQVLLE